MSSLAKQLGKLQLRSAALDSKLGHSFLFTDADAKQLSREQVHQLAIAGLQTLLNLDNRFHPVQSRGCSQRAVAEQLSREQPAGQANRPAADAAVAAPAAHLQPPSY